MSDLKRFDMNGTPHVNGHYCDAQEAADLIEQQQARIAELEAKTSCCMGVGNGEGLSPLFARDIEYMNEDDLITVFDRVTAELEKRSSQSKVIAQAEHEIESRTSEPAISTHLGILYDAGMLKLPD